MPAASPRASGERQAKHGCRGHHHGQTAGDEGGCKRIERDERRVDRRRSNRMPAAGSR